MEKGNKKLRRGSKQQKLAKDGITDSDLQRGDARRVEIRHNIVNCLLYAND